MDRLRVNLNPKQTKSQITAKLKEQAENLSPYRHRFTNFPAEVAGRILTRRLWMKRYVAIAMICLLSACSGAPQYNNASGAFSGGAGYSLDPQISVAPQRAPDASNFAPLATHTAPPTSLPFHSEKSRQYSRRGKALNQRSAALAAFRSRESFWRQGESEAVNLGKYKLLMRQVRVDTHDFVVVQHASHTFGARKFNLSAKTKEAADARTSCSVTGDGYFVRDNYVTGMVFPLSC
ncbi:hypothetical protein [Roseovarius aestuarii]|uniref:Uncharacterized protein n=1 Tax=Roseovarius aestuarii TaxID=475083 RepID=A0A1X7BME6_9RHOB|nr:hypothetical protein [Roseovarius aestuarii]SMC10785.1 hypothetical protein ROA7745_00592 [Roseovarius aestuarii]